MDDKVIMNARIYSDIQGLKGLQYSKDTKASRHEIAKQFESMMMQMVLSSMRNANKVFESGLYGSQQMEFYQDMYDKQLSLSLSGNGVGFADIIEKSMARAAGEADEEKPYVSQNPVNLRSPAINSQLSSQVAVNDSVAKIPTESEKATVFTSQEDFVKKLWSSAKAAASAIGTTPEILLAQAALETNWGKNIIPQNNDTSSNNLFNIKADNNSIQKTMPVDTLEQRNGVLVKEKSSFRSYDSFKESFMDYVNLLKENGRYNESLNKAAQPEQFVHALQNAGYATDQGYADKIMKIFSSHSFQNIVNKVKSAV